MAKNMKNILATLLVLITMIASGCTSTSWRARNSEYVEVMRGDTLYSISKKYNVPIKTLADLNNLYPPYSLNVGQILTLPSKGGLKTHTIAKGDTLYNVSKRYDVPLRDIIETNNLKPPYNLALGQNITIPNNRYHIVSKGDTLYNISKRYDVDVTSLRKTNNIRPPYTLSIGDKLVLPGSISSDAPTYQPVSYGSNTKKKSFFSRFQAKKQPTTTYAKKQPEKTAAKRTTQTTVIKKRTTKFAWPVKGPVISNFGTLGKGRKNDGINIKAAAGTPVNAADKGSVVYAGNELKGFGNLILIKHPDGYITAYAHNDKIFVRKGQSVRKGEKISSVGKTGGVNIPQLHFEVHANKKPVNPMSYLE